MSSHKSKKSVNIVICPGVHSPQFTQEFIAGIRLSETGWLQIPPEIAPYDAPGILNFLQRRSFQPEKADPLVLIGFSAGVVGAIGAAWGWQLSGGQIRAMIALDGWGVPLYGQFPIHRVSHDAFTHWSSVMLGGGNTDGFYANPAVPHLQLWRSPETTEGCWLPGIQTCLNLATPPRTVSEFLTTLLQHYGAIPGAQTAD